MIELYTYSSNGYNADTKKKTDFTIKTGANQEKEIGAFRTWDETDMAGALTSAPSRVSRGYTTKPFRAMADASGSVTIWLIADSNINGYMAINGMKIEPAASQRTATCIGSECTGWRLVAQEPSSGQQGLAFLGIKFSPSQSSGFTAIKIRENSDCDSSETNLGTFTGSDGLEKCAAACAAIGSCKFFILGIGTKAGICYQEHTDSVSCKEGWGDAKYDFYQLNELTATKIGTDVSWSDSTSKGYLNSKEFGPYASPVSVGYYSLTSGSTKTKATTKWVIEGRNSDTGWTLLDDTKENGNGVTSWNADEQRDYAMNKDTSPAIWVFAMKSDTDYKMNSVGKEEFNRLFSASKTRIVKFLCESCVASHREIYYKRLKTIGSFDLYENMYTEWKSTDNERNNHFNLYSSYQDAVNNQNKWSSCNYDSTGKGFPRDCGPSGAVGSQWIGKNVGQAKWSIYIDSPDSGTHQWILTMAKQGEEANIGKIEFDAMFDAAPEPKIIKRTCATCEFKYSNLYYRRLTPVPKDASIYDLIHTRWKSDFNVLGVDFDIYDTFGDATVGRTKQLEDDGKPYPWWEFCNYDDDGSKKWGFPGECRKDQDGTSSTKQWTNKDNTNNLEYKFSIQTTKAVTKTECCTSYRVRSLEVGSGTALDMSAVQLYEESDTSDTNTQSFNLGPDLEHGADYNQVAIVWDGFDSGNKAKNYVSFKVDEHLFVDTVDDTIALKQVKTNNDQARAWFDRDGGATFCRATSLSVNGGSKPGGSSWAVVPKDSTKRDCGCHGKDDEGDGMFYGGIASGCDNDCGACQGGGWSGAVANEKPHGKAAHTNQMVQFWVRMASTDDMDTSSDTTPFNWVSGGDVKMIRYGVKEAGGLGCLQDGMPGCDVDCSMEKGYTIGVAEQTADVRLPGGENYIQLGNFRLGTTNNGDTFEIVHVETECQGCGDEPKVFDGKGTTIVTFKKDGSREESSKNQMGEKIDLSCTNRDCGGAAGSNEYKPKNGIATVTTSANTYDNGVYYNIGYMFDGSGIKANLGQLDSGGTAMSCHNGDTHTCYWMVESNEKVTITIKFTAATEIGEMRIRTKGRSDSNNNFKIEIKDSNDGNKLKPASGGFVSTRHWNYGRTWVSSYNQHKTNNWNWEKGSGTSSSKKKVLWKSTTQHECAEAVEEMEKSATGASWQAEEPHACYAENSWTKSDHSLDFMTSKVEKNKKDDIVQWPITTKEVIITVQKVQPYLKVQNQCIGDDPCSLCQGDCDSDNDCEGTLVCYQRDSSSDLVPGCAKGGAGDKDADDYCTESLKFPTGDTVEASLENFGDCSVASQCAMCQGDCDNDSECTGILKCFQRSSSSEKVPGCKKGGSGDVGSHDYCYVPGSYYTTMEEIEFYRPKAKKEASETQELWNKVRGFGGKSNGVVVGDETIEFDKKWRICRYDDKHLAINHINNGDYDKTAMIWRCDGRQYVGPRTDYKCKRSMTDPKNIGWGDRFVEFGEQWRIGESDDNHLSFASTTCSIGHGGKDVSIVYRSDGAVLNHGELKAMNNEGNYLCEGDCDNDNECSGDSLCMQRDQNNKVPGCFGGTSDGWDYCYIPSLKANRPVLDKERVGVLELYSPRADGIAGGARCEGDCDSDLECRGDLICFVRDSSKTGCTSKQLTCDDSPVPGCKGTGTSGWSYCIDPLGSVSAGTTWDYAGAQLPHSLSGRVVTVDPIPRGIGAESTMANQRNCGKWCDGKYLTFMADNGVGSGLPSGLVAYWPLDGNGEDSSLNGLHLSEMVGLLPRNNGKVRQAYRWQGVGSGTRSPDTSSSALDVVKLTTAAWVYPLGAGKVVDKQSAFSLYLEDPKGKLLIGGVCSNNGNCASNKCGQTADSVGTCVGKCMRTDWSSSKSSDWNCPRTDSVVLKAKIHPCEIMGVGDALIPPNTWTHVALTFDGTDIRMYVNALQVYTGKCGTSNYNGDMSQNDEDFRIGSGGGDQDGAGNDNFNGRIDEVMLFDRALSKDELVTVRSVPQPSCEFHPAGSIVGVPAGDGSSEKSPGRDCQVLKSKGAKDNGIYWIQPNEGVEPFEVYCDQKSDDGGWTLVYKIAGNSDMKATAEFNSRNALLENDMTKDSSGKMSDNMLRSLCTEQYKVVQTDPKGNALSNRANDLFCKFDDITKFGDDVMSNKKCGVGYSDSASYTTALTDTKYQHGFSTWGANGAVVTQLLHNPGCLPGVADCNTGTPKGRTVDKYFAQSNAVDTTTNGGTSRILNFKKRRSDSVLRIHYSDTVRCSGDPGSCRWRLLINGYECDKPGKMHNTVHVDGSGDTNTHHPTSILAICRSTEQYGDKIPAGDHELRVYEDSQTSNTHGSPYLGWSGTTWMLEVDELDSFDPRYGKLTTHDPSWGSVWDSRSVEFLKGEEATALRIEYYDNWRCNAGDTCRFELFIDDKHCVEPGPLRHDIFISPNTNTHYGKTFMGYCTRIDQTTQEDRYDKGDEWKLATQDHLDALKVEDVDTDNRYEYLFQPKQGTNWIRSPPTKHIWNWDTFTMAPGKYWYKRDSGPGPSGTYTRTGVEIIAHDDLNGNPNTVITGDEQIQTVTWGWHLAAKIKGSKNTWDYDAALWTNSDTFDDGTELKTDWYNKASRKLRVLFKSGTACNKEFSYTHDLNEPLTNIFGTYRDVGPAATEWKNMGCGKFPVQNKCNKIGFNVEISNGGSKPLTKDELNLVVVGTLGCTPANPCTRCQGDCDNDNDCSGALKCKERSGTEAVKGCTSGGAGDVTTYDYCYDEVAFKNKNNGANTCTPQGKCDRCQGDCDSDLDCNSGLKCFQRSSTEKINGCLAGGSGDLDDYDYCFDG